MNLRFHIDSCKKPGWSRKDHKTAVIVNYKMGLAARDPEETDVSLLTKKERGFLIEEGLLAERSSQKKPKKK